MRLQEVCEEIIEDVDGALGCAVVDLGTGLPLAVTATSDELLESGAMETLAAAGTDYFRGEVNHQLQSAMGGVPGDEGFVEEIQTTTDETYHFMCVVPGNRQTVLLLITDKTTNLGLGWVAVRRALRRIEEDTRRPAVRARKDASSRLEPPEPPESPDSEPPDNPMNGANRRIGRRRYRRR